MQGGCAPVASAFFCLLVITSRQCNPASTLPSPSSCLRIGVKMICGHLSPSSRLVIQYRSSRNSNVSKNTWHACSRPAYSPHAQRLSSDRLPVISLRLFSECFPMDFQGLSKTNRFLNRLFFPIAFRLLSLCFQCVFRTLCGVNRLDPVALRVPCGCVEVSFRQSAGCTAVVFRLLAAAFWLCFACSPFAFRLLPACFPLAVRVLSDGFPVAFGLLSVCFTVSFRLCSSCFPVVASFSSDCGCLLVDCYLLCGCSSGANQLACRSLPLDSRLLAAS